jgi:hypothetical protein
MNRADALEFVSKNHRAVLVTRRADEGLQTFAHHHWCRWRWLCRHQ